MFFTPMLGSCYGAGVTEAECECCIPICEFGAAAKLSMGGCIVFTCSPTRTAGSANDRCAQRVDTLPGHRYFCPVFCTRCHSRLAARHAIDRNSCLHRARTCSNIGFCLSLPRLWPAILSFWPVVRHGPSPKPQRGERDQPPSAAVQTCLVAECYDLVARIHVVKPWAFRGSRPSGLDRFSLFP